MTATLILPPPPLQPLHPPVPRAALFLDFDGTLVEIAPRPDAVRVPPDLPSKLQALATGLEGALAVVSGRPLSDLDFFLPVPIAKAGDHGAAVRADPALPPELPDLPTPPAAWRVRAAELIAGHPGALIEDKAHGFVLHYRLAPELAASAKDLLGACIAEAPAHFTLLEARMAWEVRPRGPSKGSAVRSLMARPPFAGRVPVFIGDDVTDEEGMEAARSMGGYGLRLQDAFGTPAALRDWLYSACQAVTGAPDGPGR